MTEQDFKATYNELADHVNAKIEQAGGSLSPLQTMETVRRWVDGHPGSQAVLSAYTLHVVPADTGNPWERKVTVEPSQDGGYLRRLLDDE
jgi:hypothetical protein